MPGFFYGSEPLESQNDQCWVQAVAKELPLLHKSLPPHSNVPRLATASVPPQIRGVQCRAAGMPAMGFGPSDGKWKWWRSQGHRLGGEAAPTPTFLPLASTIRPASTSGRQLKDRVSPANDPSAKHQTHLGYIRKPNGTFYKTLPSDSSLPISSSLQHQTFPSATSKRGVQRSRIKIDPQHAKWMKMLKHQMAQLKERHADLLRKHGNFSIAVEGPKFRIRAQIETELGEIEKELSVKRKLLQHFER